MTSALVTEIGLAEAAEHARRGNYSAALAALEKLDSPAALDLSAKVHAQQGDLDAADRAWAQVLVLVPDDSEALAGRKLIAEIKAGKRKRPVFIWGAAAAALVALLVAGAVLSLPLFEERMPVVATQAPPDPLRARLDQLEAASAEAQEKELALRAALSTLAADLEAPGVRVERRAEDVRVVFDDGMFLPDGNSFTPDGRRALEEWAQRLSGKPVRATVVGHGVLLPGGPATGGSTVALSRASAAADVLAEGSGLPLTAFAVTSADQSDAPHADAARNRTVSVLVVPS
jgi:flagellar motor protein MotB